MSNERPGPARTACVFCSGELKNTDQAEHAAENCDLLLATDGGANHLARLRNGLVEGHGCVCVFEGVLLLYVESDELWAVP